MAFTFESDSIYICPYICPHSIKSHRPKTWPRPFWPDHWKSSLTHSSPNYLHKSLNHQNPVTGLLWKGKSRSLKHFKLKSQRGFPTLVLAAGMITILIVRFLAFAGLWRNKEERWGRNNAMVVEEKNGSLFPCLSFAFHSYLSHFIAHLHSEPSLIDRLTCQSPKSKG